MIFESSKQRHLNLDWLYIFKVYLISFGHRIIGYWWKSKKPKCSRLVSIVSERSSPLSFVGSANCAFLCSYYRIDWLTFAALFERQALVSYCSALPSTASLNISLISALIYFLINCSSFILLILFINYCVLFFFN